MEISVWKLIQTVLISRPLSSPMSWMTGSKGFKCAFLDSLVLVWTVAQECDYFWRNARRLLLWCHLPAVPLRATSAMSWVKHASPCALGTDSRQPRPSHSFLRPAKTLSGPEKDGISNSTLREAARYSQLPAQRAPFWVVFKHLSFLTVLKPSTS